MDLITNKLKDLVVNADEARRLCHYINMTIEDFAEFVNNVFNSDSTTPEKWETEDFIIIGEFEVGTVSSSQKNALAVGIFPKKEKQEDGPYKMSAFIMFKAIFFENGDLMYDDFSRNIGLSDGEYPFVYISEINDDFSYITGEKIKDSKIPLKWFENNNIPELFPKDNEYESLILMNFGERSYVR